MRIDLNEKERDNNPEEAADDVAGEEVSGEESEITSDPLNRHASAVRFLLVLVLAGTREVRKGRGGRVVKNGGFDGGDLNSKDFFAKTATNKAATSDEYEKSSTNWETHSSFAKSSACGKTHQFPPLIRYEMM
ncbi:unnamed protein product [Linum trigynum]|uniref:Uncharacterized protein n=1 Tax=Linum trigynum TaxID=586398 RepID=A0AAV2FAV2_9ROSI